MMREVLSGTLKSGKRNFVKVNQDNNLIESLKKTLKRTKYKFRVGCGSHKKRGITSVGASGDCSPTTL
jgi:hypothetical protein